MRTRSILSVLILIGLLCSGVPMQAQSRGKIQASQRFQGTQRARVSDNYKLNLHHGIVATLSAVYYSGDMIHPVDMFRDNVMRDNMSGSLAVNYKLTFNPYVSMRIGLQAAYLRGNNQSSTYKDKEYHDFKAWMLQPFFGAEVYPILNYGFFIYAGFGVANSIISSYEHQVTSGAKRWTNTDEQGNKIGALGICPMFQFGLGYNWWIDRNWTIGVELLGQVGVKDGNIPGTNNTRHFGMDAWPIAEAYTDYINRPGKEGTKWQNAYNSALLPDGLAQLGLVVSYHF